MYSMFFHTLGQPVQVYCTSGEVVAYAQEDKSVKSPTTVSYTNHRWHLVKSNYGCNTNQSMAIPLAQHTICLGISAQLLP